MIRKQDRHLLKKSFKQNWDCYLYMAPYGIIFFAFTVLPVLASIFLGFTYYNILINELSHTMRAVMVTILYAPSISGGAYTIWAIIFSGDAYGWINSMLLSLGLVNEPLQFLTDSKYMMTVCCIVVIWMSLGTGFLSNVAGFRTIDRSLYEAGYIEGIRNRWQELWFITLQQMKPMLMFSAVMSITQAFTVGDICTTLFGFPSTDYATHTILNHIQDYGGQRFEVGYSSAIAVVLFAIMIGSNMLVKKVLSKVGQ